MAQNLVKKVAKELAGAFYGGDDVLNDGRRQRTIRFRNQAVSEAQFIRDCWPSFIEAAKLVLGQMLQEPGRSQKEKDAIYDALLDSRGFATDEKLVAPSVLRLN